MKKVPVATRCPMRKAASSSRVQTDAVRPNSLSFISATASSSPETGMMPTIGAKLSSCIMRIPWSTPTRHCGAM